MPGPKTKVSASLQPAAATFFLEPAQDPGLDSAWEAGYIHL